MGMTRKEADKALRYYKRQEAKTGKRLITLRKRLEDIRTKESKIETQIKIDTRVLENTEDNIKRIEKYETITEDSGFGTLSPKDKEFKDWDGT